MSRERLELHRRIWQRKPVLGDVYAVWFDALLAQLPASGQVLEIGAGPGFLTAYARSRRPGLRWVAADLVPVAWNDVVADGQRLPLRDASLDAVVALDLVHHLARPGEFFRETARVLRRDGRLVVVEPWVTPLSYPVYRWLHQEGCRPGLDPWRPFADGPDKDAFEGDSGVVSRLIRSTPSVRWRELGLAPPRATALNGFAYLFSLGFRDASLLPRRLAPVLMALDRGTAPLAAAFGMRVLAVWRRDAGDAAARPE